MTDPRVRRLLAEPLPPDPELPPLNEVEEWVIRHLQVGALLLPEVAGRYRELRARRLADGVGAVAAEALDAAGDLAAVVQGAQRQEAAVVVLGETELETSTVFGALEQILHSLLMLTSPVDEELDFALAEDELDDLLAMPGLEDYLDPEGAIARLRPPER